MVVTIKDLEDFENYLYSSEIDKYIKQIKQEEKMRFINKRNDLSVYISKARTAQIKVVAIKLEQSSKELQDGINNIKKQIASLEKEATILSTFSDLLGVFEKVFSSVLPLP